VRLKKWDCFKHLAGRFLPKKFYAASALVKFFNEDLFLFRIDKDKTTAM
jgi:hypothetical protein